jgi:hypothetical protein
VLLLTALGADCGVSASVFTIGAIQAFNFILKRVFSDNPRFLARQSASYFSNQELIDGTGDHFRPRILWVLHSRQAAL